MACDASIGWRGYALVQGLTLPYLNGSFSTTKEILPSESLISDGSAATRSEYNYTVGKSYAEGKLSCEVFGSGAYGQAFKTLLSLAVGSSSKSCNPLTGGGGGSSIVFSPNGRMSVSIPGSGGKAVIDGFNIRGNPGGIVSADFSFKSTNLSEGIANSSATMQFEAPGSTDDGSPLPYYSSSFVCLGAGDDSLITNYLMDWNISLSVPVTPIYTFCNPTGLTGGITASDLRLGRTQVTGSFSYYSPDGTFSSTLKDGASISIYLQSCTIVLPSVTFTNDSLPNSGANKDVLRIVQFRGFGTSSSASISVQ